MHKHYFRVYRFLDFIPVLWYSIQVLAVFNLKDPQSQFGDWISLFLKAAFMAEGKQAHICGW